MGARDKVTTPVRVVSIVAAASVVPIVSFLVARWTIWRNHLPSGVIVEGENPIDLGTLITIFVVAAGVRMFFLSPENKRLIKVDRAYFVGNYSAVIGCLAYILSFGWEVVLAVSPSEAFDRGIVRVPAQMALVYIENSDTASKVHLTLSSASAAMVIYLYGLLERTMYDHLLFIRRLRQRAWAQ